MLILTRKVDEEIIIGDNIRVIVDKIGANKVRLAIDAPTGVIVDREEIAKRRAQNKQDG